MKGSRVLQSKELMEWNNNNKACVSVWFYLAQTKQLKTNFDNSPGVKMADMRFWNETSPEATAAGAQGWSEWLVSYLTSKDGASFEAGYTWAKTVAAMVKIMTVRDNTVLDLTETVDNAIRFFEEV